MSINNIWWWIGVALVVFLAMKLGRFLLKAIVVGVIVIALVFVVAPQVFAATPEPWTTCNSTVTWGIQPSPGTPETAPSGISSAYSEVGDIAHLTLLKEQDFAGTASVRWSWDDPGAGITHADADTSDTSSMTNVTARVHEHSRAAGPSAGPALQTVLLKDIGRDMGVPLQATGGHLTPGDKAALKASCASQAAAAPVASSTPTPGAASDVTAAPDGPAVVNTPATARPPAHPVMVTGREKVIGYGGAAAAAIVLMLTLAGSRLRNLPTKAGLKVPSWSSVWNRISGLRKRQSKAKTE
jgi:hypothetical protein